MFRSNLGCLFQGFGASVSPTYRSHLFQNDILILWRSLGQRFVLPKTSLLFQKSSIYLYYSNPYFPRINRYIRAYSRRTILLTNVCYFSMFGDTLFCSFELHKFGELTQKPFLYLKLTSQQAMAIVQSQARTQHSDI